MNSITTNRLALTLQQQYAERQAAQANLKAEALQLEAKSARQDATKAENKAQALESSSVQASADAATANQKLEANRLKTNISQEAGQWKTFFQNTREQLANAGTTYTPNGNLSSSGNEGQTIDITA